VRYDHSKALAQKLKQARKSFKFVTLKDGDHHLSNQKDRIKFLQEVEKFLAKNL
jgi:dipeptidyl aminopeptidase/acylaminoacyl peptidase|tara:strand:- start:641 stop:802 length:162 start_codon:yes stop_codon:yes gene_type:complete